MYMKKTLVAAAVLLSLQLAAQPLPRITVIATGGTIAGTAPTATQAGYSPARLTVESLLGQVPQLASEADVSGYQLCNIPSQAMTHDIWLRLACVIDSLFTGGHCDGVVVTHGTDTMEETAYFLHLTVPHDLPVVLTGAMRPATGLSADGPMNLYNAVMLAASPLARDRGVMVVMNDYIFSADDIVKTNTVNPNAFECPNYGPLGTIRGGVPVFSRKTLTRHTSRSEFSIRKLSGKPLPHVEIVLSYANASDIQLNALIDYPVDGIVIAGVGNGNFAPSFMTAIAKANEKKIPVVRATRIISGGVSSGLEDVFPGQIAPGCLSPQKARILLMLALTQTDDPARIGKIFLEY